MSEITLTCRDEKRRRDIIASDDFNGMDYIEVTLEEKPEITVVLLQKVSPEIGAIFSGDQAILHIRLEGGNRIKGDEIEITGVILDLAPKQTRDDKIKIRVDKAGDFSTYTLRFVDIEEGSPTDRPLPGFDPRYASLDFSFKADCPSDLDCKTKQICPPVKKPDPDINYLAKDYASFRQLILDRLSQIMPEWKERHVPDLGIALVEVMAYVGDYLSYHQDAVATEAYLATARQRISVRRHARLVDYEMHEGNNARTWVHVQIQDSDHKSFKPDQFYFVTGFSDTPKSGEVISGQGLSDEFFNQVEVFEPLVDDVDHDIHFYEAHNEIPIYTWGDRDCCLPKGTTSVTLRDEWLPVPVTGTTDAGDDDCDDDTPVPEPERRLKLEIGDFLLFEEVLGAKNGREEDADNGHRHIVKITNKTLLVDELPEQDVPLVEVEWSVEDALPFPLCISAIGEPPDCCLIEDISVARGNILLADHGRSIEDEALGEVQLTEMNIICLREHRPSDERKIPELFRPTLKEASLAFRDLPALDAPASKRLIQDPRKAVPQIELTGCKFDIIEDVECIWAAKRDLLRNLPDDRHFVVEIDDERKVHLRFGDGELGRLPEAGMSFTADYRVGNGPSGNVGAERICHFVHRPGPLNGVRLIPRNPFPAQGGTGPEPVSEVKFFAPTTFRKKLERAVTPDDYARLTEQHPGVQRAAATFRWTGSWYELLVAIDPFGGVTADETLLESITEHLFRFRRAGHDLVVRLAEFVPLDITMEICVLPGFTRGHVKAALLEIFGSGVRSDGELGYFHPDNLTFGQSIRLSQLIAVAQAVPGVESVDVTKLQRLFEGDNDELENGILIIQPFEIPRLDNDPSFPENGRLQLNVRGER